MKNIILLGSTGSVGRNVLDIVRQYPDRFRIKAIAASENVSVLIRQAEEFRPDIVAIGEKSLYERLKEGLAGDVKVVAGAGSLEQLAGAEPADIIFMAISGTAALRPLIAALKAGRTVALASKEPVVSAGMIIRKLVEEHSSRILPVDSEHSAIMQCLGSAGSEDVRTLFITGSGGPLRDTREDEFDDLSVDRVLAHPKWDMGKKITVDSATLMNKGLEVIEARWLFDMPQDRIKVVIHPQAVIHAMVEFVDGTVTAGMFRPDMRFPVLRALSFPEILASELPRVDFSGLGNFSFSEPDFGKFPALELAREALRAGGTMPAVMNGANETAVGAFLDGKIKFTAIIDMVGKVLGKHKIINSPSIEDIIDSEKWAAREVLKFC